MGIHTWFNWWSFFFKIQIDANIENNDERTYSNKYELDLSLEPCTVDLGIDVIHSFDSQPSTINEISNSHISHESDSPVIRQLYDSRKIERNLIDSDSTVASDDFIHIYNLGP